MLTECIRILWLSEIKCSIVRSSLYGAAMLRKQFKRGISYEQHVFLALYTAIYSIRLSRRHSKEPHTSYIVRKNVKCEQRDSRIPYCLTEDAGSLERKETAL